MEMKEYLSRIRQRILRDGADETLKMIRAQKLGGPSASEIFGEEAGARLAEEVAASKSAGSCNAEIGLDDADSRPCTLTVYTLPESVTELAESFRAANDDYFDLAVAA